MNSNGKYVVVKRNGKEEDVAFDKIHKRLLNLMDGLDREYVDTVKVSQKVIAGVYNGIHTSQLDRLAAETCAYMSISHHHYDALAARLMISDLHKRTDASLLKTATILFENKRGENDVCPLISEQTYRIIVNNAERLQDALVYDRDYQLDYFGFLTLNEKYLLCVDNGPVERPQHMYMRVAIGIHGEDIESVIETYNGLSSGDFMHATPTLYNSGTPNPQLSSCFLLSMTEDSIDGIYETLRRCAKISSGAGGIGFSLHNIRAKGSYIRGSNGTSNGIVPLLRVYNNTARYVDQGGGKRKGGFAVYIEPWHADIFDFLELRKNTGAEDIRARDLFYALWIPDLFMQRVEADGLWSLMCPDAARGLQDVWGAAFDSLYALYEQEPAKYVRRSIKARKLWVAIITSQIETGQPYMLYKDACNGKSNQQNLGTIKLSNLCTEIVEYTCKDEVAVCNLASIGLPRCCSVVRGGNRGYEFDFDKLCGIVRTLTRNLNRVIDVTKYPIPEARRSNLRHRPTGIGVQGWWDVCMMLRYPMDSHDAKVLNLQIFETIYFAALSESCALAEKHGPYETYEGSPISKGQLQFDMWGVKPSFARWDWDALRQRIAQHGVRNSLLIAQMPTASTSQILKNTEGCECRTSNIYTRRVLSGEFLVTNNFLVKDLIKLGLWNETMREMILRNDGSIQDIDIIPKELKELYKMVWEIKQRAIVDQYADRAPFICQSQSMNIFMASPTHEKVNSLHFYAWKKGLKTGLYYLRSRSAVNPIKFTVSQVAPVFYGSNSSMARQLNGSPPTPAFSSMSVANQQQTDSPILENMAELEKKVCELNRDGAVHCDACS